MNKKVLPLIVTTIIILFAACSSEDILPEENVKIKTEESHSLTFTASFPEDDPETRVSITEDADSKSITFKWEEKDVIELLFVQGETKAAGEATVNKIIDEGTTAEFSFSIPEGINEEPFDLYGIYGGSLDETDPSIAAMPNNAHSATSLDDMQTKKLTMLYFKSTDFDIATAPAVSFKHVGSIFTLTIKNTSDTKLEGIFDARIVGINPTEENKNWAYNPYSGHDFIDAKSEAVFWSWASPLENVALPDLKIDLRKKDESGTTPFIESENIIPTSGKTAKIGKRYSFYAVYDGKMWITKDDFDTPSPIRTVNVETAGDLKNLLGEVQKASIVELTVTGNINADDFEVMKNLPNLTTLNLKDAIVEGNTIPPFAFGQKKVGDDIVSQANIIIASVVFPKSITSIGEGAFTACNLTDITLYEGLVTIEKGAFDRCKLTEISLPSTLKTIGNRGFTACNFNSIIEFPENLESIGNQAFFNNNDIKKFIFNNPEPFDYTNKMLSEGKPVVVPTGKKAAYEEKWGKSGNHEITEM